MVVVFLVGAQRVAVDFQFGLILSNEVGEALVDVLLVYDGLDSVEFVEGVGREVLGKVLDLCYELVGDVSFFVDVREEEGVGELEIDALGNLTQDKD